MKSLSKVNFYIKQYKLKFNIGKEFVDKEKEILLSVKNKLEWYSASEREKQEKRKAILSIAKKTQNKKVFSKEIAVIELYDLFILLLKEIEEIKNDFELLMRLDSMIEVFIFEINRERDLNEMKKNILEILLHLVERVLESDILISDGLLTEIKEQLLKCLNSFA